MCNGATMHTQKRDLKFIPFMKIMSRKIKTDEYMIKSLSLQACFDKEIKTF